MLTGRTYIPALIAHVAVAVWLIPSEGTAADGRGTPPRTAEVANAPIYDGRIHYVGRVWASVSNVGILGARRPGPGALRAIPDPLADRTWLKIDWIPCYEFPPHTRNDYLSTTGLVFGSVRAQDTLVSADEEGLGEAQAEFHSFERLVESSNSKRSPYYTPAAVAEQEYSAVFSDTLIGDGVSDLVDQRRHKPIGLEVHQSTYGWSDKFSAGFIIADWWFKNISSEPIRGGCIGFVLNPAIYSDRNPVAAEQPVDDVVGFLSVVPGIVPGGLDTINIAWAADNDGDPENGQFVDYSVRGVMGVRVLRSPQGGRLSFNWWGFEADGTS